MKANERTMKVAIYRTSEVFGYNYTIQYVKSLGELLDLQEEYQAPVIIHRGKDGYATMPDGVIVDFALEVYDDYRE